MNLSGRSIIGYQWGAEEGETLQGVNPSTGQKLLPAYHSASDEEVGQAVELARQAFGSYCRAPGRQKADFLRAIATNLEERVDDLAERGSQETGLPDGRIRMETGRTCGQLRLFAGLVEEGSWVDARIDRADPDRAPLPKPDLRSMLRPLGPVAVFCASNFPVAFSVAGGDTASALAAGNPVLVNAHFAHPGTSELAGTAIREAAQKCGLPEGVFSLLFGAGLRVGRQLVSHPHIRAVGFTGSRKGGRSLMDLAAARPEPIPVFAEMSSVNPVFLLPGALRQRSDQIAQGLCGSVTLGAGQFCTNPGVVVLSKGPHADGFARHLAEQMGGASPATMLHQGIHQAYRQSLEGRSQNKSLELLAQSGSDLEDPACQAGAALFRTDAASFLNDSSLADEIFGPSTLLVQAADRKELLDIASALEGQLTATLHGTEEDLQKYSDLVEMLESKAGRLVFNGFPTGVEVCPAMVHGGPYPATSDGRSTSVGTRAIARFCRPVCYQDFPSSAIPPELQDGNPLGIWRLVDGHLRQDGSFRPSRKAAKRS